MLKNKHNYKDSIINQTYIQDNKLQIPTNNINNKLQISTNKQDNQPKSMKNPSQLLPLEFGQATFFKSLSWDDFKGKIDQKLPWSAHIFWHIEYIIIDSVQKKLTAKIYISKKSWVRCQKKCDHLLNHQQGHYLIGALCLLQFLRRVEMKKQKFVKKFEDLVSETFDRTMKEHLQLQRKYDNQTQHRMNFKKQQQWDEFIYDKLTYYISTYDRKKHKFVKLCQSPQKKKTK